MMLEVAKMSMKDRSDLITYTSNELGVNEAIVEKDFWVCFMLDLIFHDFKFCEKLAFKGGTSLSKGYNVIERFSEDIDIILDWRLLGYSKDEPWNERSKRAQEKFNEEASIRTRQFLESEFIPEIIEKLDIIGIDDYKKFS